MAVEEKKTLNDWFPNNGKFTQAGRTLDSIQESTGPHTIRHHADTTMMSKIKKYIQIDHTESTMYTRDDIDRMLMPAPSICPHVRQRNDYVLRFHAKKIAAASGVI